MRNAIGSVRVSSDEQGQSGAGLAAQRAAILAEAKRRGWRLVEVVEDVGYSGKGRKRPGIETALEALRQKRADTLVVTKFDRLSRSMLDFSRLMDRASRQNWALVALDLALDTSTPAGDMMANVLATFAQFERRLIAQRTRDALAVKRAQGVRLGRDRAISPDVAERIRAERASGMTLQAIADGLDQDGVPTARGGKHWYTSTVRAVVGQEVAYRAARRGEPSDPSC